MKKLFLALLILIPGMVQLSFAQNMKVTSGVVAFQNNDFEEAIEKLNEALSQPELLKESNIPKAHYYLCQSYQRVMQDPTMQAKYPDALSKAFDSYSATKATMNMTKGASLSTIKNGLTLTEQVLFSEMFNRGVQLYQADKAAEAVDFLKKSEELNAESYLPNMMLGYALIGTKDTVSAVNNWNTTIEKHAKVSASTGRVDTLISSVYLSLANVNMIYSHDSEKALKVVEAGLKMYPNDSDLQRTELSIYQQDPALAERALTKFENALQAKPDDITVKIAYADLLSKAGQKEKSISMYEEVLAKDPDNLYANLNLAASYINDAKDLSELYEKNNNETEGEHIFEQIKETFQKAYPYMKKTHELEPDNMEWIRQMIQITGYLGMNEEMMEYHNKQKEMMKE
jgi:tetratricopeptide (TPR) repeat protein